MILIWGVPFPSSPELSKGTSVPGGTASGCALREVLLATRSSSAAWQGTVCWRVCSSLHSRCCCAHTHLKWLQTKRGKKKKKATHAVQSQSDPVNNNINCHQWSGQCYKSLLNHGMSMLKKFPFSLKPCVIGRDESPACPCPSHIREAWVGLSMGLQTAPAALWDGRGGLILCLRTPVDRAILPVVSAVHGGVQYNSVQLQCPACLLPGLTFSPSHPVALSAQPGHLEILTLLRLPATEQTGLRGKGEGKKATERSSVSSDTRVN